MSLPLPWARRFWARIRIPASGPGPSAAARALPRAAVVPPPATACGGVRVGFRSLASGGGVEKVEEVKGRWMVKVGDTCSKTKLLVNRTWIPHEDDTPDEDNLPVQEKKRLDEFTGLDLGSLRGFGVVHVDKTKDLKHLVENFTAPALAAALRDREETLHICAVLIDEGRMSELGKILRPFHADKISERRLKRRKMFLHEGFKLEHVYMIRKYLHRMPRQLPRYAEKRASVMLPLCNAQGVPCVLFQYRSDTVRSHKSQVCFPGGVVDNRQDANIVETCLREMQEEMGIDEVRDVCGVLRCDWGTIAKLVGVSVTPVVGWMGDIEDYDFSKMNPEEVQAAFTVPVKDLLEKDNWIVDETDDGIPTLEFIGGPHRIWGLTAFLLYRFLQDVLKRYRIYFEHEMDTELLPQEEPASFLRLDSLDAKAASAGGKSFGDDD